MGTGSHGGGGTEPVAVGVPGITGGGREKSSVDGRGVEKLLENANEGDRREKEGGLNRRNGSHKIKSEIIRSEGKRAHDFS